MNKILFSRKEIKQRAKSLYSQTPWFMAAAFFSFLPSISFSVFSSLKMVTVPLAITFLISFFQALLFHPLFLGLYYLLFQRLNSQKGSLKELLHFYSPTLFIKASGLWLIIRAFPLVILFAGLFVSHLFVSNSILSALIIVITILVSIICGILTFVFWSLSEYLLASYSHLSVSKTLRMSFHLIRGNCKTLLTLYCSFLPWYLIAIALSHFIYKGTSFELPETFIFVISFLLLLFQSVFAPYYHLTFLVFTEQLLKKGSHKKSFTIKNKVSEKKEATIDNKDLCHQKTI